jgi:hypothetical protein
MNRPRSRVLLTSAMSLVRRNRSADRAGNAADGLPCTPAADALPGTPVAGPSGDLTAGTAYSLIGW